MQDREQKGSVGSYSVLKEAFTNTLAVAVDVIMLARGLLNELHRCRDRIDLHLLNY